MLNRRRITACLLALALFIVACEEETEQDEPITEEFEHQAEPETYDLPLTTDQPLVVEGTPTSPPPGFLPGASYVVSSVPNPPNPDGTITYTNIYGTVEGDAAEENWAPGIDPQGVQTGIVDGQMYYLHPFDSDGDGLYDTMSHYRPPPQGINYDPGDYDPGYIAPPAGSNSGCPRPPTDRRPRRYRRGWEFLSGTQGRRVLLPMARRGCF